MKLEHAQAIVAAADRLGKEVRIHESYSGRGMFGKRTTGVTGSKGAIVQAIADAAAHLAQYGADGDADDFVDGMDLAWDSMGLDSIAY